MSPHQPPRVDMGRCCLCSEALAPDSFRARESYLEAHATGLCQACQDACFLACSPDDRRAYPIHEGALVSVRAPSHVSELFLFPFRFVVPAPVGGRARLVWEARALVRAGPYQDRLDVRYELEPMCSLLAHHQVCMTSCREFSDPRLETYLESLHLLVALDEAALGAIARVCLLPDALPRASFADEVPWRAVLGRELRPLESWCGPEPRPLSTMRVCAVMGSLLVETGRTGLRPLDYLLQSRVDLFRNPSDA